jgi:hypothetical protein
MSLMPEYDATAGFPALHIEAFKRVAGRNKVVISSRELNPLCTDLVLESYAAKGFHIKAKTCDWGPMAGFVLEDSRFTKGSQDQAKQRTEIANAFGHKAGCVPVFISDARLTKLRERKIIATAPAGSANRLAVTAAPKDGTNVAFVLVKSQVAPPGGDGPMWGVYYDPSVTPERASGRNPLALAVPGEKGLEPVTGMVNPDDTSGKSGVKSAVAGDYDLWCLFPHETAKDMGFGDRAMDLRATMPKSVAPALQQRAAQAGLVFQSPAQKGAIAAKKENEHLGNISLGLMKIRAELNREVAGTGYKAGNVVQHSDYGGNPFGDIDYPLIFFIPKPPGAAVDVAVARNLIDLKTVLKTMSKLGFRIKLNPAWSVPSY